MTFMQRMYTSAFYFQGGGDAGGGGAGAGDAGAGGKGGDAGTGGGAGDGKGAAGDAAAGGGGPKLDPKLIADAGKGAGAGELGPDGKPKPVDAPQPWAEFHGFPEDGKFEVKAPDGIVIDPKMVEAFTPVAKALNLGPKGIQKLVDHQLGIQKAQNEAWITTVNGWGEALKTDKEFGGTPEAFAANEAIAKRAMDVFGSEGLKKVLGEYGFGNHPEVFRLLHRVGRAIVSEDNNDRGKGKGSGQESDVRDLFYGPPKTT